MDPRDGQMYFEGFTPRQQSLFPASSPDEPVDTAGSREFAELLEPFEGWLSHLFSFWSGGTEKEWARAAWAALGRRGLLTEAEAEVDFIVALDHASILVTLSAINSRFQGIRNGEGEGCSWLWAYPYVNQTDLGVSDIQIGRWAEREGLGAGEEEDESLADILKAAAFSLSDQVYTALETEWGEEVLFSSLWTASQADSTHPATSEVVCDLMNRPTDDLMAVHEWFTNDRDI